MLAETGGPSSVGQGGSRAHPGGRRGGRAPTPVEELWESERSLGRGDLLREGSGRPVSFPPSWAHLVRRVASGVGAGRSGKVS